MSGAPGYVHISQRGPAGTQRAQGTASQGFGKRQPANLRPMNYKPEPPRQAPQDNEARGFVIYVGLSEEAAAEQGTSLVRIVQDTRAYVHNLAPEAESYAAVALSPLDAEGSDLEVVRNALGDPTAVHYQPETPAHQQPRLADREDDYKPPHTVGVLIDLSRREVYLDSERLSLTYKEFELLGYLVENMQRTVTRDELLGNLWGQLSDAPSERTIDVHIRRLRSKLGRLSNTVRTVRGQGYRFYDHPEVVIWAAPEYSI